MRGVNNMELKVGDSIIIFNGEQRKINHIFKTDNKIAYGIDKEFLIDYSDGGWGDTRRLMLPTGYGRTSWRSRGSVMRRA